MNIRIFSRLELQQIHIFDVQRLAVACDDHNDRQPHRRFRRRHHNHKENENQSVQLVKFAAERHKRQVHRVQHQLDGHKNRDDIAFENKSDHAQSKKHRAQNYVIRNRHHSLRFLLGEHQRAQNRDKNQDRRQLKRQHELREELHRKLLRRSRHWTSYRASRSCALAVFVDERVSHLHQKHNRQRNAREARQPAQIRAHFHSGVEQHNYEHEQHHNGAGINENLYGRDKRRAEQQVQDRQRHHHQHERKGTVHRLAREDQSNRAQHGYHAARDEHQHRHAHERILSTTTRPVATRLISESGSRNFQPNAISWS